MNVGHFRHWLQTSATAEDVEDMRTSGQVNIYTAELACQDVLCVPPGWLILEHCSSQCAAGIAVSWLAPVRGARDNLAHLLSLIPPDAKGGVEKLRVVLSSAVVTLESLGV